MNADIKIVTNTAFLKRKSRLLTTDEIHSGYAKKLAIKLISTVKAVQKSRSSNRSPLGLAAIQLDKPEALCIVKNRLGQWLVLINPLIINCSAETKTSYETCLSFPGKPFEVIRYNAIKVRYLDTNGKLHEKWFSGKVARRVQHEIDHINGIVPTKKQFERGQGR